ncbi:MAG TPA: thioredoxin family protein [Gemmatimonadaceae bacterium]
MTGIIDRALYERALPFERYLDSVEKHPELWRGVYRTATLEAEAVNRLRQVQGVWRLLAISEDWCGDCVSTLPIVARLAEAAGLEFRVVERDPNPELMDAHLTSGTRSIPVLIVLDDAYRERGWWGPRPAKLQRWYRSEAVWLANEHRGRRKRAWYARDRGRSAVSELVEMIERAARLGTAHRNV